MCNKYLKKYVEQNNEFFYIKNWNINYYLLYNFAIIHLLLLYPNIYNKSGWRNQIIS